MKKSELVVGREYLSNGRHDWNTSVYDVARIRIVDLTVGRWSWKNGRLIASNFSSAMTGLRVEALDKKTGEVKGETVVTLASIRGEWEPTFAKIQETYDARIKLQNESADRHQKARDRVGIVMAKVKSFLGLTSDYETSKLVRDDYKARTVVVDIDFLDAMITELDKQGWTYKP